MLFFFVFLLSCGILRNKGVEGIVLLLLIQIHCTHSHVHLYHNCQCMHSNLYIPLTAS